MARKDFTEVGSMTRVEWAWTQIDEASDEEWDDMQGWSDSDFQLRYGVDEEDAGLLWLVVQSRVDSRRSVYDMNPTRVGEMIQEALHQGLDGWTIKQGLVIQAFLSDIGYAVSQVEQDKRRARDGNKD